MKKLFVISLAVILCLTLATSAFAAGKKAPGPPTAGVQAPVGTDAPLTTNRVVKKTYITSGIPFVTLPAATFTALDAPVGALCPAAIAPCTLLVDAYATSGADAAGGNRALCLALNGALVGACPYSGRSATDGSFSAFGTDEIEVAIGAGTTTAQIFAFSDTGATVYTYRVVYRVMKP